MTIMNRPMPTRPDCDSRPGSSRGGAFSALATSRPIAASAAVASAVVRVLRMPDISAGSTSSAAWLRLPEGASQCIAPKAARSQPTVAHHSQRLFITWVAVRACERSHCQPATASSR